MSYTIIVKVFQTNPNAWFEVIESTVWHYANGGSWTKANDKYVLTMGSTGTSGILRFQSGDQYFIVALGVDD
ncbi:hypothetical protein EXIGLDRAFT_764915 [Exidia glandulosa HHB12029]|uniref:Lectin n=1 Tax=Exidia glandulosa HHB12029 TaxID=1314781 RepID=A0A165KT86_EXIGL|nr:hypothetical protein EXIGLDRAFT_764915 [Exidia glandulosa HHB12029]